MTLEFARFDVDRSAVAIHVRRKHFGILLQNGTLGALSTAGTAASTPFNRIESEEGIAYRLPVTGVLKGTAPGLATSRFLRTLYWT